jgi:hypothetical protein
MCKASQTPGSLEGSKLSVTGQKIKPHGTPKKPFENSSEIVFQLTVSKNGKSIILEENEPKLCRFREYSFLDKDSEISGPELWGFSSDPLGPHDIRKGGPGRTSSHTGQFVTVSGTCFMEIIKGWKGTPLLTHPKETLLC